MSRIREGIHRHYKGNLYHVICVAKHSETLEDLVVYRDVIDEEKVWVLPLFMWNEEVDIDGKMLPRCQFLAQSMDELDEKPMFRLIEAIKENMEQYKHLGEYNALRFYHKQTGEILVVGEGLCGLVQDGEDTGEYEPECVAEAENVLEHWNDWLRLPDNDINGYRLMEEFIYELPVPYQHDLERAIQGKGAFHRFKDTAARLNVLEDWYRYRDAAYRREARMWCDTHGIAWWMDLI